MMVSEEGYQALDADGEADIRHLLLPATWASGCAVVSNGQTAGRW